MHGALAKPQVEAIQTLLEKFFDMTPLPPRGPVDCVDGGWEGGFLFDSWQDQGFSMSFLDWTIRGLKWLLSRLEHFQDLKELDILNVPFIMNVRNPRIQLV